LSDAYNSYSDRAKSVELYLKKTVLTQKRKWFIGNLRLDDSYPLKSLAHPTVMPDFLSFSEAACTAVLIAYVVSPSSAASAFDVDGFALPLAH
jgi:hypothetical protein